MKYLKTALKLAVSVLILYLVVQKIDTRLLFQLIGTVSPLYILWAASWFIVSKIIAAYRFQVLIQTEPIVLSVRENLRLYWLGMYYNLLLPGGISGDGYKIKILMDRFKQPFKRLFTITLMDRITGAIALGQLCLILLPGIPPLQFLNWLWILGLVLSIPVSYYIYHWAKLQTVWARTSLQAIAVQMAQTLATLGLIFALDQGDQWLAYSVLFLISSVVAMLPLTIGGAGAREITFLWGAGFLGIDAEKAVAIAFLFYLVSTAVALFGMVYSFNSTLLDKSSKQ
ncbi:MAG: lysylphosphatidylglycerol synthase transmembrane domain-containing protein [Saprospiraceae bacterium]